MFLSWTMTLRSVLESPGPLKSYIFAKAESWVVTQVVQSILWSTLLYMCPGIAVSSEILLMNIFIVLLLLNDIVSSEIRPDSQSETVQSFLILKILL